jgi:hypothetical protein
MRAAGGVVGNAAQHVGEPGLRVDVVELGGDDQRVIRSGPPAAAIGAGEEPVLAADGNARPRLCGSAYDALCGSGDVLRRSPA